MSERKNLRVETHEAIEQSAHKINDIIFIGSRDQKYSCTWDWFRQIADVEYESSNITPQEVAADLVILFKDGEWLERATWEDGFEGWVHRKPFPHPYRPMQTKLRIHTVFGVDETLAGMNDRGKQ